MAAAMVAGGMPPGAALVFLMAGPASNMATMGAIYKGFGLRNLGIYLGTLIVGSMGLALAFEELIDPVSVQTVLASAGMVGEGSHAHGDPAVWWDSVRLDSLWNAALLRLLRTQSASCDEEDSSAQQAAKKPFSSRSEE